MSAGRISDDKERLSGLARIYLPSSSSGWSHRQQMSTAVILKVSASPENPELLLKIDLKLSPDLFFFPAEGADRWLRGNWVSLCRR